MLSKKKLFLLFSVFQIFASCSKNEDYVAIAKTSPVILNLDQVPYPKLSDYNFFDRGIKNQNPVYGVIPYKPASELFTDYSKKKRFVWLPNGTKMNYVNDGKVLDLPVGAALIKSFYYTNVQPTNTIQIIETRVLIRKNTGWIFTNYVWNQDQTEAFLDLNGSIQNISFKDDSQIIKSVSYQIPSATDCITCHKVNNINNPIGIKPQNLNYSYNYAEGAKNQLSKFIEFGYMDNNLPSNIVSVVDCMDTTKSLNLRARSYFDANCSHCHQDGGYAGYFSLRFAFNQTTTLSNMGVCVRPNHFMPGVINDEIVKIGDPNRSMLYQRLLTNLPNYRMPFKGRTIQDTEGLLLVEQWINSLTDCN